MLMGGKGFTSGKKYSLSLKDGSIVEGVFVFEADEHAFFKLKSGYNTGFKKNNIKSFKETGSAKKKEKKAAAKKPSESLPKILILHTGGTIASKIDYSTGAVTPKFSPEEILEMYPEISSLASVESKLISNIPSDDMNFHHYNVLCKEIKSAVEKDKSLKGIILTHGTDTMHYTSAALSFALEEVPLPVVLVGSQRSSDRPSSDAALNLLSASLFIIEAKKKDARGVFICMHESINSDFCSILKGVNAKKMHSSRRDAFKPVNTNVFARVDFLNGKVFFLEKKYLGEKHNFSPVSKVVKGKSNGFKVKLFDEKIKVGLAKSRPGLTFEELKVYKSFDGLLLEGTGLGHFPIGHFDKSTEKNKQILELIRDFAASKIVCMSTQAIHGRVNLNVYSHGRSLKNAGVLGHNLDMSVETAYVKIAWLLSNYDLVEAKRLYSVNLRGEISKRSEAGFYE